MMEDKSLRRPRLWCARAFFVARDRSDADTARPCNIPPQRHAEQNTTLIIHDVNSTQASHKDGGPTAKLLDGWNDGGDGDCAAATVAGEGLEVYLVPSEELLFA